MRQGLFHGLQGFRHFDLSYLTSHQEVYKDGKQSRTDQCGDIALRSNVNAEGRCLQVDHLHDQAVEQGAERKSDHTSDKRQDQIFLQDVFRRLSWIKAQNLNRCNLSAPLCQIDVRQIENNNKGEGIGEQCNSQMISSRQDIGLSMESLVTESRDTPAISGSAMISFASCS